MRPTSRIFLKNVCSNISFRDSRTNFEVFWCKLWWRHSPLYTLEIDIELEYILCKIQECTAREAQ